MSNIFSDCFLFGCYLCAMDPKYLKKPELVYELRIRGNTDDVDQNTGRTILRLLLKNQPIPIEAEVRKYNATTPFFIQRSEIESSLVTLENCIKSFKGKEKESGRRISARRDHLYRRIDLCDVPEDQTLLISEWKQKLDDLNNSFELRKTRAEMKTSINNQPSLQQEESALRRLADLAVKSTPKQDRGFQNLPSNVIKSKEDTLQSSINSVQTSTSRSVPVYKWAIKFTGEECGEKVSDFLASVEELRLARGNTKEELFVSAFDFFSGPALIWYRSIKSSLQDWDDLVRSLKINFLPSSFYDQLWDEIRSRKQRTNEKTSLFIAVLQNLFDQLLDSPSDTERLRIIRRNLKPEFNWHLATHSITSINELSELCRRLEEAKELNNRHVTFNDNSQKTNHQYKSKNQSVFGIKNFVITCFNCKEPGHTFLECKQPRSGKFCYRCGKPNTISRDCSCKSVSKNE